MKLNKVAMYAFGGMFFCASVNLFCSHDELRRRVPFAAELQSSSQDLAGADIAGGGDNSLINQLRARNRMLVVYSVNHLGILQHLEYFRDGAKGKAFDVEGYRNFVMQNPSLNEKVSCSKCIQDTAMGVLDVLPFPQICSRLITEKIVTAQCQAQIQKLQDKVKPVDANVMQR